MTRQDAPARGDEQGFTLVEVLLAMLLLATVALAFLPLAARAGTSAARTVSLATATRMVSEQLELRRAESRLGCPTLDSRVRVDTVTDPRGDLEAWARYIGPCAVPGTVRYEVTVIRVGSPADPVATATTLLPVQAW